MKLSEAIREGAKLRPQAFGSYFDRNGHSCAIGAAIEGATGKANANVSLYDIFEDYNRNQILHCPECNERFHLKQTITHLNDDHHLSRPLIAEWLEQQGY